MTRRRARPVVTSVLRTTALALVAWFVVAYFLQRRVVFPVDLLPNVAADPALSGVGERWFLDVEPGRVEALFLPGDGVSADAPGPAVVWAHGNGEVVDLLVGAAEPYRSRGASVLLVEYRGYGRSDGSPSEAAIVDDTARFVQRLAARPEVDATRIVYHGVSLGGGVACQVARRRPPAAVVLVATFRSVRAMAWRHLVPPFLVRDPFDNEAALAELDVPVLVMHGRRDEVVPLAHGEALAVAAGPRARFVAWPGAHMLLTTDRQAFWATIETFLVDAGVFAADD